MRAQFGPLRSLRRQSWRWCLAFLPTGDASERLRYCRHSKPRRSLRAPSLSYAPLSPALNQRSSFVPPSTSSPQSDESCSMRKLAFASGSFASRDRTSTRKPLFFSRPQPVLPSRSRTCLSWACLKRCAPKRSRNFLMCEPRASRACEKRLTHCSWSSYLNSREIAWSSGRRVSFACRWLPSRASVSDVCSTWTSESLNQPFPDGRRYLLPSPVLPLL